VSQKRTSIDLPQGGLALSYRISRLFEVSRRRDEPIPTDSEVAAGVSTLLGKPVIPQTIAALRSGATDKADPTMLSAIARHFAADENYLVGTIDDQLLIDRNLDLYLVLRDEDMAMLGLRSRTDGLSTDTVADLCALIKNVRAKYASPPPSPS
jgi:hypothetical protein